MVSESANTDTVSLKSEADSAQLAAEKPLLIQLDVTGMTCAACANRIEKKLNKVTGVQASVNYATAKAHVALDLANFQPTTEGKATAEPGKETAELAEPRLGESAVEAISENQEQQIYQSLIAVVEKAGYSAARPKPNVDSAAKALNWLWIKMVLAVVFALPVIFVSMVPAWQFPAWQWVAFALTTVVVFGCGAGFHRTSFKNLIHRSTSMDTLISLGTLAAYLWSAYAMIFGTAGHIGMRHHFHWKLVRTDAGANIYFEAACGIIMFILIGRFIEARSKRQAGSALAALANLGVKQVTRYNGEKTELIPIELLKTGDVFLVQPGEKVATDGQIIEGHSAVDNSLLTGESIPVEVVPGDLVIGASINTSGRLVVKATNVGAETKISQIAKLIEQAQSTKSEVQQLADKISGIFVPTVITIALITLIGWLIAGEPLMFALPTAVAVLIIACPCALGLATPTALLAGSGRGAQLGILIHGIDALQRAKNIDTVVFDKTGTITTGKMSVAQILPGHGWQQDQVIQLAGAVESSVNHPIAKAIVAEAEKLGQAEKQAVVGQLENLPGLGIICELAGKTVLAGKKALLEKYGVQINQPGFEENEPASNSANRGLVGETEPDNTPASLVYLAQADANLTQVQASVTGQNSLPNDIWSFVGLIKVVDQVKPGAKQALEQLSRANIRNVMLTGDQLSVAKSVAAELSISEIHAQVLPEEKLAVIANLQTRSKVAMVGDGVNDAPALAKADFSIAMGAGTDVAIAASDVTLVRSELSAVPQALRLAKKTLRIINQNMFWAFCYNTVAIPLAALGFLNPMLAGLAMSFSSVFVVTNSIRLTRFK